MTEGAVSALDEYELAAVRLAFTNGRVTAKELAERIGRSQRTATRVLKGIAGPEGLLEWHGSSINDPRQFYALRENPPCRTLSYLVEVPKNPLDLFRVARLPATR